eukprot:2953761-Prymnesium_polylepis.1
MARAAQPQVSLHHSLQRARFSGHCSASVRRAHHSSQPQVLFVCTKSRVYHYLLECAALAILARAPIQGGPIGQAAIRFGAASRAR